MTTLTLDSFIAKERAGRHAYYLAHRDRLLERLRNYRLQNPERIREQGRRSYHKRLGVNKDEEIQEKRAKALVRLEKGRILKRRWNANHRQVLQESCKRWQITHPEEAKEARRKWEVNHRLKRRELVRRYRATHPEKVRDERRRWRKKHPDAQKGTIARWWLTEKGKAARRRGYLKRRGLPITFFLNESFPNSHLHHLGGQIGVYIPIAVHRRIYHELATGKGMIRLNDIIADWMNQTSKDS